MAIRVLMVDEDINHMNVVKQYFSSSSSIKIVNTASSKDDALKLLNSDYDVLLLNMLLSDEGSFTILSTLKEMNLNKSVIATSEYISPQMMSELSIYAPEYFIKKPYSMESLEKIINSIGGSTPVDVDNELKIAITDILHSLGIPSHIKGYNYIRDGITMMYKDSTIMNSITKELYPHIANNYSTTSSRVERAIRHAIEVSWMRGDYNVMEELFGNSVDFDKSKPTNSEFMATVADRLKLKYKYV